jgi:hypothetical protein
MRRALRVQSRYVIVVVVTGLACLLMRAASGRADDTQTPVGPPVDARMESIAAIDTFAAGRSYALIGGLACDPFGRVWLSDGTGHRIIRLDADGQVLDQAGALGSDAGQFRRPGSLAVAGALGVAVLDIENRRVSLYDHHLRLLGAAVDLAASALEERVGRITPVGLAADRGGALYVADSERDRLLVFDFAGTFQHELGGFGARSGGFSGLAAVAAAGRGMLVTLERPRARPRRNAAPDSLVGRSRVQWLDAAGRVVRTAWTPVWSAGTGETGFALATDDSGRVAITGERSGEWSLLGADGRLLAHRGGFASPTAVAFASDGRVLLGESGAARIVRLDARSTEE